MAYSKNANLLLNVVNVNYYTLIQKSKVLYTGNLGTYSRKSCVPFDWLSSTAQQSVIMVVLKSFLFADDYRSKLEAENSDYTLALSQKFSPKRNSHVTFHRNPYFFSFTIGWQQTETCEHVSPLTKIIDH